MSDTPYGDGTAADGPDPGPIHPPAHEALSAAYHAATAGHRAAILATARAGFTRLGRGAVVIHAAPRTHDLVSLDYRPAGRLLDPDDRSIAAAAMDGPTAAMLRRMLAEYHPASELLVITTLGPGRGASITRTHFAYLEATSIPSPSRN